MTIAKKYLRSRPACKVKFIAPSALTRSAKKICLAGDFNDWDASSLRLRKQKTGEYSATIELTPGQEYQYRYVLDDTRWENDHDADKYVPNNICSADNSVVVV